MSTRLLIAIKNNESLKNIETILAQNLSVMINEDHGFDAGLSDCAVSGIALHLAAAQNNPALVRLLLSYQADPNQKDENDNGPFEALLSSENLININNEGARKITSMIDCLFKQGARLPLKAFEHYQLYVQEEHASLCTRLLQARSNRARRMCSEKADEYKIKKHILKKFFYHQVYGDFIQAVCDNNVPKVTEFLSDKMIDLGHTSFPKDLVLCSVSVDFRNDPSCGHDGLAVLEAAKLKDPGMLALLHQHHFSFSAQDPQGDNALHYAVRGGSLPVVEWIFREQEDVFHSLLGQGNKKGNTPMHMAYEENCSDLIGFFQAKNKSPCLMNFEGKRPGETVPDLFWLAAKSLASRPTELASVLALADDEKILLSDQSRFWLYVAMEQALPHLSDQPAKTASGAAKRARLGN